MEIVFFAGLIFMLLAFVAGQWLILSARRALNAADKARLVAARSASRASSYRILMAVAILFGLIWTVSSNVRIYAYITTYIAPKTFLVAFAVCEVILLIAQHVLHFRKLRDSELPQSYLSRFRISAVMMMAGLLAFLVAVLFSFWPSVGS